jgi:hypothetical protein
MNFWTIGHDTTLLSQIPYAIFYAKSDAYPHTVSSNIGGVSKDSAHIQERMNLN